MKLIYVIDANVNYFFNLKNYKDDDKEKINQSFKEITARTFPEELDLKDVDFELRESDFTINDNYYLIRERKNNLKMQTYSTITQDKNMLILKALSECVDKEFNLKIKFGYVDSNAIDDFSTFLPTLLEVEDFRNMNNFIEKGFLNLNISKEGVKITEFLNAKNNDELVAVNELYQEYASKRKKRNEVGLYKKESKNILRP